MSRIGKQQINLPSEVNITFNNGYVEVRGPLGQLSMKLLDSVEIQKNDRNIKLSLKGESKTGKAMWGLSRSLINNMVVGVSKGFTKKLEINGVGYKASTISDFLVLTLGYSHDIMYPIPNGISIKCNKNFIEVSGYDKQLVGQVSANIRSLRKPEPYKGKGIKYENEIILRKEGKKK